MNKITLARGRGFRVESGHPWIYNNEIENIVGHPEPAEIVEIYNFKNVFIGNAYYNPKSQIAARIISRKRNAVIDKAFFREKLTACKNYRERIGYKENYRLVFGDGDLLPGLVIDKFGDYLVLQTLTLGMDSRKTEIIEVLNELFSPKGIYERNDVPVRKLEGLEEQKGFLSEPFDTKIIIVQDGIKFEVDLNEGQKTGFFLDQKENKKALKNIVSGADVLDCFCYTGSFSMAAAFHGAKHVTGLDISEQAVAQATRNAKLNNVEKICHFKTINTFDYLPQLIKEEKLFDVIIADPPAFTKNRAGVESAVRGYKEINLRAMKLLKPGGFLLTFSCSHYMTLELFFDLIKEAANNAGRNIRQVAQLQQAKDHPILWDVEETFYLKGFLLQIL